MTGIGQSEKLCLALSFSLPWIGKGDKRMGTWRCRKQYCSNVTYFGQSHDLRLNAPTYSVSWSPCDAVTKIYEKDLSVSILAKVLIENRFWNKSDLNWRPMNPHVWLNKGSNP